MGDFYCPVCGVRPVSREGEICNSCRDPYADSGNGGYGQTSPAPSSFSTAGNAGNSGQNDYQPISRPTRRIIGTQAPTQQVGGGPVRGIMTGANPPAVNQPNAIQQPIQSAPLQASRPVQVVPAQDQTGTAQTDADTDGPITEGIVKNLTEGKDPGGKLSRWFRSLIMGIPYARTDDITEFQVYSNWTGTAKPGSYSADKVIAYGNISYGKPVQDNSVRVYGVRDKNRVIIARDIQNTTDGVYSVFDPKPMSSTAVRIITLVVVALAAFLIYALINGVKGIGDTARGISTQGLSQSASKIIAALIAGAIAFISGKRAIQNFGNNWKSAGICALIALVCASACISMISQIF